MVFVWFDFSCEIAMRLLHKIIIIDKVLLFGLIHCDTLGVINISKLFFHGMRISVSVLRISKHNFWNNQPPRKQNSLS